MSLVVRLNRMLLKIGVLENRFVVIEVLVFLLVLTEVLHPVEIRTRVLVLVLQLNRALDLIEILVLKIKAVFGRTADHLFYLENPLFREFHGLRRESVVFFQDLFGGLQEKTRLVRIVRGQSVRQVVLRLLLKTLGRHLVYFFIILDILYLYFDFIGYI